MAKLTEKMKELKPYDLIVVDGKNMCFKYYHSMYSLKNRNGVKTGLYHGFLQLLTKLRKENLYSRIVIVWEGGELVRKKMMKSYKAQRAKPDDNFTKQIINLKNLLGLMGVEQKYSPGYEADDVAATLVNKYEGKVLLVSGDDDWLQLMRRNVFFFRKNKKISYEEMKKKKGFPPERIMIYNVLKGKPANNVKGICYFPEVLALDILNKCSMISDIFSNYSIPEKYSKWTQILWDNMEDIENTYDIINLKKDVALEDLPCKERNWKQGKKILIDLQLFKVMNNLREIKRMKKEKSKTKKK